MKRVEIRDWLKRGKENILPAISRMLPSWLCVCVCVETTVVYTGLATPVVGNVPFL